MSYEGSMMGSGIYSTTETHEVVCNERCITCEDRGQTCSAYWDEDFETDDWGNIEATVRCNTCGHDFTFKRERD